MRKKSSLLDFQVGQIRNAAKSIETLNINIKKANTGRHSSKRSMEKQIDKRWKKTQKDLNEQFVALKKLCITSKVSDQEVQVLTNIFEKIYINQMNELNYEAASIGKKSLSISSTPAFGGFQLLHLKNKPPEQRVLAHIIDEMTFSYIWSLKYTKQNIQNLNLATKVLISLIYENGFSAENFNFSSRTAFSQSLKASMKRVLMDLEGVSLPALTESQLKYGAILG